MSNSKKPMLIITNVTSVSQEKVRSDNKASRLFVGATFSEAVGTEGKYYANPFRTSYRNIFQKHSADGMTATWKITPDQLGALKAGQLAIPGEIVTKKVESYAVLDAKGNQQKTKEGQPVFADKYTAVVLGGEDVNQIFKAAGHEIIGEVSNDIEATSPASELAA